MSNKEVFLPQIRDMGPYRPPLEGRTKAEDTDLLDFNERLDPPFPLVLEAIEEELQKNRLQTYPEYGDLDPVIADYIGVRPDQVISTNGGDQGIDIVNRALIQKVLRLDALPEGLKQKMQTFIGTLSEEEKWQLEGSHTVISVPTFAMLEQSAHVQGAHIISPRYSGPNLEFPFNEVMQAIKPGVKLVVICNPNNPTGTPIPREQTKAVIEKAGSVGAAVMADEAYHEFTPELTVVDLIDEYPNLFIIRSFSKTMGLARLRAGCVVSQAKNIAELRKIRGPYDVNGFAAAAMKTLRFPEVREDMRRYVSEVMTVSKPMLEKFYRENGVRFFPSSAGFHLLEAPGLYDFLRNKDGHKILVRPRSDPPGTVRVTIGPEEVTQRYIEAFKEYLQRP